MLDPDLNPVPDPKPVLVPLSQNFTVPGTSSSGSGSGFGSATLLWSTILHTVPYRTGTNLVVFTNPEFNQNVTDLLSGTRKTMGQQKFNILYIRIL